MLSALVKRRLELPDKSGYVHCVSSRDETTGMSKRDLLEVLRDPMVDVSYGDRLKAADELERLRAAVAGERATILELIESLHMRSRTLRMHLLEPFCEKTGRLRAAAEVA
jgi:hypothetical protein